MLNFPRTIPLIKKKLTTKSFYAGRNQRMYRALLHANSLHGEEMDSVGLSQSFSSLHPRFKDEGIVYISDILIKSVFESRVEWYIEKALDYQARRRLLKLSQYTRQYVDDISRDTNEIIQKLQSGIDIIRTSVKYEKDLKEDIEEMSSNVGNSDAVIEFGTPILDRKIAGFMRNDITTIGGRTSHGKTTFAIDTIKKQLDLGYKVSLITNEVTKRLYLQKLTCNIANIEYRKIIKYGNVTDEEMSKFNTAKDYMLKNYVGKLNIYEFVDTISAETSIISADKPDIFWLDWLQRIPLVPGIPDPLQWIKIVYGEIAKTTAKTNTASVVISQLSTRKSQQQSGIHRRPQLFDFDDSSFIEKASCDCHLIYWYYNDTLDRRFITIAELINAKNRFGEPGISLLAHNPLSGRYEDSSVIGPERKRDYGVAARLKIQEG